MSRALKPLIFVFAAALPIAALAQGYIGGAAGRSDQKFDCAGTTTCDTTDTGFKLFGGFMFSPNFGVEGAYYDLGKATATLTDPLLGTLTGEVKTTAFGAYALGVLPFDQWSLFGKLGVVNSKVKVTASSALFGSGSESKRHTDIAWGIGGGYDFNKSLGLRLEWERGRAKFGDEKFDGDLLSVGVKFSF